MTASLSELLASGFWNGAGDDQCTFAGILCKPSLASYYLICCDMVRHAYNSRNRREKAVLLRARIESVRHATGTHGCSRLTMTALSKR